MIPPTTKVNTTNNGKRWLPSEELKMRMTDANTRDASGRKLDWIITNWANVSRPKVIRVEADNISDHHPIIFK